MKHNIHASNTTKKSLDERKKAAHEKLDNLKKKQNSPEIQEKKQKIKKRYNKMTSHIFDWMKMISWLIFTLIASYVPVYVAQVYENSVYASMGGHKLSSALASHYTQMITFAYNTASLFTVLIAYLMLKHLISLYKRMRSNEKD